MKHKLYKIGRQAFFSLAIVGLLSLGGCVKLDVTGAPQAGGDGTGIQGMRRLASIYDPSAPSGRRGALYSRPKSGSGLRGVTVSAAFDYFYEDAAAVGTFEPIAATDIKQVDSARTFYLVDGKAGIFEKERDAEDTGGGEIPPSFIIGACIFEGNPALGEPVFAAGYVVHNPTLDVYSAMMEVNYGDGNPQGSTITEVAAEFTLMPSLEGPNQIQQYTIHSGSSNEGYIGLGSSECSLSGFVPNVAEASYLDIGTLTATSANQASTFLED